MDHGRFNIRDEIEYQTARENREQELMKNYERQGFAKGNYPQYGTNFWGNSENNYGFGSSNISSAISTHPAMNTTPTLTQSVQSNRTPTMSAFTNTFGGYGTSDAAISGYQATPKQNTVNAVSAPRTSTGEILLEGLKGFGEGIENGVLRGLNTATLGLYDLGNYYFLGNQYANKQSELQAQAEAAGLGGLNKLSNYAIDVGMGGKSSKKLLKSLLRYYK